MIVDLSKTRNPYFTLLSQGVLTTGNPTALPGHEDAGPAPRDYDRAVRSARLRTSQYSGRSLDQALHAVDSNLDSDGLAIALSDPSIQRRQAALRQLTPAGEPDLSSGPVQAPRLY